MPLFKNLNKTIPVLVPAAWFQTEVRLPATMLAEIWMVANLGWMLAILGLSIIIITVRHL